MARRFCGMGSMVRCRLECVSLKNGLTERDVTPRSLVSKTVKSPSNTVQIASAVGPLSKQNARLKILFAGNHYSHGLLPSFHAPCVIPRISRHELRASTAARRSCADETTIPGPQGDTSFAFAPEQPLGGKDPITILSRQHKPHGELVSRLPSGHGWGQSYNNALHLLHLT